VARTQGHKRAAVRGTFYWEHFLRFLLAYPVFRNVIIKQLPHDSSKGAAGSVCTCLKSRNRTEEEEMTAIGPNALHKDDFQTSSVQAIILAVVRPPVELQN
jgi:hypothetical protein